MAVRVKICGVTNLADATVAAQAGAWAIGFNFYRLSPRYIAPAEARSIRERLPASLLVAGVFVDEDRKAVAAIKDEVGLSLLQFHGAEPPQLCQGWNVPTIKALRIRDRTSLESARSFGVDFILADAYVEGTLGGTGKRLDPALLEGFDRTRLILAGGLTPDNVKEAVELVRPHTIDVASGVERAPGHKDPELIRRFIENAYSA